MIRRQKNQILGIIWAGAAVTIWSGSLVLLRFGVITNLNAYDLTALRFCTAALLLMPVIIRNGFAFDRLRVRGLILMIAGFGAPYIILISLALKTAPASAAGAINPGVMAIVATLIGVILLKDKIIITRFSGMVLIVIGMLISVLHEAGNAPIGYIILVFTGVMWAGYAFTVRKNRIAALHSTAIVAVGSALFYMPVYIIALPKKISTAPVHDILLQMGFQGVLVSIIAVFAFNRSAELLGPTTGAALPALIPLVTLIIGALVLNDPLGIGEITAAVTIGVGVGLILMKSKPHRSE